MEQGNQDNQQKNKLLELEEIKVVYFTSKYINLKNFLKATSIKLPDNVSADDLLHWNAEKKDIRDAAHTTYAGIKSMYADTLMDRLDAMERINDKVLNMLDELDSIKDIKTLIQALDTIAKLQDDTIKTLNIDTSSDGQYNKNTGATDKLLEGDED